MNPSAIISEFDDGVLTVTFNRPDRLNAMTAEMESELINLASSVNSDDRTRVVVFTGATGKRPAFVAGQDIGELDGIESESAALELEAHSEELLQAIEQIRVPTIAAIGGPCVGVGALIVSCCDIVLATDSVKFGFPIARTVGNLLSSRNYLRMVEMVGTPRVKNMVLRARLLSGAELAETGAASELLSDEDLMPRAREIASQITRLAPLTLRGTKETLLRMRNAVPLPDNTDLVTSAYLSDDYAEAVSAFLEKRSPIWKGR